MCQILYTEIVFPNHSRQQFIHFRYAYPMPDIHALYIDAVYVPDISTVYSSKYIWKD